jgi:hypothetical protein
MVKRIAELENALRIARTKMAHGYNCVQLTQESARGGSAAIGACICEIATVEAALAGTKEQP